MCVLCFKYDARNVNITKLENIMNIRYDKDKKDNIDVKTIGIEIESTLDADSANKEVFLGNTNKIEEECNI